MRSVNRIVRTGEGDSDQQDALFRDDPLAGHLMPLLPPAPMNGAPPVGADLQEVIHIDSFRQLQSDGQSIRVSGTSSAKGNGGGA